MPQPSSSSPAPSPRPAGADRPSDQAAPPAAAPGSSSPRPADPSALLPAAARGDDDAWRGLLRLYSPRVYALARSRLRSDELAEEVTQSVFVTVSSKLTRGSYDERGRFEPWLFRIAMNRVRDEARRRTRHADPTDPADLTSSPGPDPGPARAADDRESLDALRSALAQLGDADREVVELRHHAGLAFQQIADLLGQPVGTVLARHHRALRKLRDRLAPEPDPSP